MAIIHGATLNASINPNGLDTNVNFLYGTEETLATPVTLDLGIVPASYDLINVKGAITNLLPTTTYFFKVMAANAAGSAESVVLNFITPIDSDIPVV